MVSDDDFSRAWEWKKFKENRSGLKELISHLQELDEHYSRNKVDDFTIEKDLNDNIRIDAKIRFYRKE